jgi:hypothetical protein
MDTQRAEVRIPIDDNDVERNGVSGGGEYSFEEVRCLVACRCDGCRRGLELPERFVL